MKKKPLFLMLGVLFLLAATLLGMATILKNDILKYIGFSVGAIFLIALFVILIKLSLSTKNYYKSFNYYYDNMLYEEGKDYFLKELPTITNNAIKTQASYYLLTFYLLLDDLEKGKELLKNTIWGNYFGYVLYFDILFDLLDGNLEEAYKKNESFQNYDQNNLSDRKNIISDIIKFIKNETDTITVNSPYPIVLNVIKKYQDE